MISLKTLQDRFQAAILARDDRILEHIPDSPRETRETLLGVYRSAYALRLVEFLQNDHELLHAYMGDEHFEAMAGGYIEAHPSSHPNARWYARHLPDYLRASDPWSNYPELADLASIEKALGDAFDAADGAVLAIEGLTVIAPADWPRLQLVPHVSARRFRLTTNALAIWEALKNEGEPPDAEPLEIAAEMIAWRSGELPMIRQLSDEERMMWDEACKGVRFGVLCEMLATYDDPDGAAARAAGYLAAWIQAGKLSAAKLLT
ncbi:MAG: DNA-binding domain-containing protein [Hyphomicrobiaceae bacterium]